MSLYYDSSVLVSLYADEESSRNISRFLAGGAEAVFVNELHEIEMRNAFRLKRFRNEIDDTQLAAALGWFDGDLAAGRLIRRGVDWQSVWAETQRLSAAITTRTGVGTIDLIHIAAALRQAASGIVSQDKRQCDAARAAGLQVVDIAG